MTPLFSSTIKVDCPDGPRFILKHPEKAFAINFPEWDVRINALVKFYNGSEAKVDPKILKRVKSIVENLTENYAALQAHYQAAYLGWCGNPCSKETEKVYNDAKNKICEKEFALRELESSTSKLDNEIKTKLRKKTKGKMKKGSAKRMQWEQAKMPPAQITKRRIPVPESTFDNIQELVAKLKI
jgi:hypothetical protein